MAVTGPVFSPPPSSRRAPTSSDASRSSGKRAYGLGPCCAETSSRSSSTREASSRTTWWQGGDRHTAQAVARIGLPADHPDVPEHCGEQLPERGRTKVTAYRDIFYETKDHVARITINRPKQYNAFTGDTLKELTLAFEAAGTDEEVGVVVLTGTGDKAFSSGGDVNWEKEGGLERQILEPYLMHQTVSHCPKPVIARVNGYCIGGANHLAYFC